MKRHCRSVVVLRISALFFLLVSILGACAQAPLAPPIDYSKYGNPPVQANVILLITEEFRGREVTAFYGGADSVLEIGRDAARELKTGLTYEFAVVDIWNVRDEADARAMLSPNDPDNAKLRKYDFVVIPRLVLAEPWHRDTKTGVDIAIVAEFHASDGSAITTVKGTGEASTGKYREAKLGDISDLAAQYAVSAILDAIQERKSLFER